MEKLWVFGPLKFLKFFIVPLKSEFFRLRPSEIFKIFACGAEKIKKLKYWLSNSKIFASGGQKWKKSGFMAFKIFQNLRLRRKKIEEI